MNRIYQGRVSKVAILNGKNADGQPLANWQSVRFLSASNGESSPVGYCTPLDSQMLRPQFKKTKMV